MSSVTLRLGSAASVSVSGSVTAGVLLGGLIWPAYEDWSRETAAAADQVVEDVLYRMGLPPLRALSVHGEAVDGRVDSLLLTLQGRSGARAWTNDTRVDAATRHEEASLGDGLAVAEVLRDPDGSLASGLVNDGDLFQASISLRDLSHAVGPGDRMELWLRGGAEKPLHLELLIPVGSSSFFEVEWNEPL